jgi:hypothetical protein
VEAAPTQPGRASTVRWRGFGQRDGEEYARNRRYTSLNHRTGLNLTDVAGRGASLTVAVVGELPGGFAFPAGRPR